MKNILQISAAFLFTPRSPRIDASVPGFRHRTNEPEYARLSLPFCRQDSIRKLAVLLDVEVAAQQLARTGPPATAPDAEALQSQKGLPAAGV